MSGFDWKTGPGAVRRSGGGVCNLAGTGPGSAAARPEAAR